MQIDTVGATSNINQENSYFSLKIKQILIETKLIPEKTDCSTKPTKLHTPIWKSLWKIDKNEYTNQFLNDIIESGWWL